jgi:AcrR family transcriptional regulator
MTGKTVSNRVEQRRRAAVGEIIDAAWAMAAEEGLAGISLRELAGRIGMRPQSLAWYFPNKNALYDAMHARGSEEFLQRLDAAAAHEPLDVRRAAHLFAAFCTENPARYQLLSQRTVPGFVPSGAAAELARDAFRAWRRALAGAGVTEAGQVDVLAAVVKGVVDQQITVDPTGDRFLRHLDEVIDMFVAHFRAARP